MSDARRSESIGPRYARVKRYGVEDFYARNEHWAHGAHTVLMSYSHEDAARGEWLWCNLEPGHWLLDRVTIASASLAGWWKDNEVSSGRWYEKRQRIVDELAVGIQNFQTRMRESAQDVAKALKPSHEIQIRMVGGTHSAPTPKPPSRDQDGADLSL